jgi:hypothetical protein
VLHIEPSTLPSQINSEQEGPSPHHGGRPEPQQFNCIHRRIDQLRHEARLDGRRQLTRARWIAVLACPQLRTEIDGLNIHFLRVRSPHANAPAIDHDAWMAKHRA